MQSRRLIKEILANFVAFIYIYALFSLMYIWVMGEVPLRHLWVIAPFYLLTLVRKKVTNFYMFYTIHAAYVALPLILLWGGNYIVPFTTLSLGFVSYSFAKRMGNEAEISSKSATILVAVLTFILIGLRAFNMEAPGTTAFFAALALFGISATIFQIQMYRMDLQMAMLEGRLKHAPKRLFTANYIAMGVFLFIVLGIGMLAVFVPEGVIIMGLLGALRAVVEIIMYPIGLLGAALEILFSSTPPVELAPLIYTEYAYYAQPELFYGPLHETDEYIEQLNRLLNVISIIIAIIVFAGIVYATYLLYKAMRRRFARRKDANRPDLDVEKLEMNLGGIKSLFARKDKRLRHPVRRAYRKKVNKHIKQGKIILHHHHHENIADIIRIEENIDELTGQYEAVRYGRNI
ncbi:MAG: hypothetical protein LBE35_02785 [Clostridiales bacterium]|jgi:hypothetical protein|nr:hypothetical protein [Clostridiales bacterium]